MQDLSHVRRQPRKRLGEIMLIDQHDFFGSALHAKKSLGLTWRIDETHNGSRGRLLL